MIRKALVGTGIALLLGLFFFGRDMLSYVRTSAGYMKQSINDSVPMEFQIDRARTMINDLVPEIRKNMQVIAREEVEVEQLQKQILEAEGKLGDEKADLLRLRADLSTGKETFVYGKRNYSVEQVKLDLANRFERYQTREATLESLRDIHGARSRSLAAARDKLEGMMAAKRQLEVDVENLEAQLKMVAAAETTSKYHFDDSKLGRVRELVADLRSRLDVAARVVDAERYYHDQIPLNEEVPANIVEQVSEYFNLDEPNSEAIAQK
jgi:chromosome segregation ATPase